MLSHNISKHVSLDERSVRQFSTLQCCNKPKLINVQGNYAAGSSVFYVRSSPKFMVLNAEPKFGGTINSVSGHICLVVQLENSYAERKYSV